MPVQGFTVDPNNAKKRLPTTYSSHEERAWCECSELADAALWEEANAKLDEYYDLCHGPGDAKLTAKIAIGVATTAKKYSAKLFKNACESLSYLISKDTGSDSDLIAGMVDDLSKGQVKMLIPSLKNHACPTDFTKATTNQVVKCADLLVRLFEIADENGLEIMEYQDSSYDRLHCIIDELLERNEKNKASPIIEKVLDLPYSSRYFTDDIADDWEEKLAAN